MLGKFSQVLHFLSIEAHVAWLQLKILFRIPFLIFNFQPYMSKVDVRYNAWL